jgi:hypothetical protein
VKPVPISFIGLKISSNNNKSNKNIISEESFINRSRIHSQDGISTSEEVTCETKIPEKKFNYMILALPAAC